MVENDEMSVGATNETEEKRKELALKSLQHCSNDEQFSVLFPELKDEIDEKLKSDQDICYLLEKLNLND